MKLTSAEKVVIGTNVFLTLILLALISLQLAVNNWDINMRQIFMPTSSTTQSPPVQSPDTFDNNNINSITDLIESTEKEEATTPKSRPVVSLGWVIIVISSCLLLGGLIIKIFFSR